MELTGRSVRTFVCGDLFAEACICTCVCVMYVRWCTSLCVRTDMYVQIPLLEVACKPKRLNDLRTMICGAVLGVLCSGTIMWSYYSLEVCTWAHFRILVGTFHPSLYLVQLRLHQCLFLRVGLPTSPEQLAALQGVLLIWPGRKGNKSYH